MSLPNPGMSVKNRERKQIKDTNSGIISELFYLSSVPHPWTEKTINIKAKKAIELDFAINIKKKIAVMDEIRLFC